MAAGSGPLAGKLAPEYPEWSGCQLQWRRVPARVAIWCRKSPFGPGPETGLSSNTRKWIVRGDTCADKARDFIGKGHPGGEQEAKGTQENCSAERLEVSGFMVMGFVSRWSLASLSNSESFLVVHAEARGMLARGILGGRWTLSVSFQPFPNSSLWWWLISSVFLIRISCNKTIHANGYYSAWPGWAVSISVLPLTISFP